jgi:hypothetical protein
MIFFIISMNDKIDELLRLEKENNILLRYLVRHINNDNDIDFVNNVIANLLANKIERR